MAAHRWIRPGQMESETPSAVEIFLREAVHGGPLHSLLSAAARELLHAGGGHRAGVWLLSGQAQQTLEGIVVQRGGGIVPEHWRNLDPGVPAVRDLLVSGADEILLVNTETSQMQLEVLSGTAKTLCLPLRVAGATLGVAIVAWQEEAFTADSSLLRGLADAVALAVASRVSHEITQDRGMTPETEKTTLLRTREIEAQLESLAESTDAGIVLFDSLGNPQLVNQRFAKLLGLPWQLFSEARTWEAFAPAVAAQFRDPGSFVMRWGQIASSPGEASWDELDMLRPTSRIMERFARPIRDSSGRFLGRLEIYRDITSEKMIQSKLLHTEKMAGLGQLISGIAHELNNPLTSIMGYSQLLLGRRLTAAQAADGRLIYQEAERAARIVKNLLLFARETRPERHPVHLNEIVERTLALRSYELRVENIRLEQNLATDLPHVLADPAQLQQVLLNLIVNAEQAIRHSSGEGTICIRTWLNANGRVALEIADNGPGIPPENIPRIFDPFFTTKPPGSGTGLGLSITYGIIQEHGGQIMVESQPGKGAKFILELPMGAPESMMTRLAGARHSPSFERSAVLQTGKVLVVEDEPTVAHLIADVMSEEGHSVEIVLDGQEGLGRALAGHYDLVICDLRMPGIDGRAIYRELVAKGSPLQHRLIFVTGDTLASHTLEFLETTGVPYLAKPFLVEELKALVAQTLDPIESTVVGAGHNGLRVQANGNRTG
ncbi:MAG TPA: ATP-binding protein [Candidatus Acidoferrales bacterium]|nr:ATP-binding protein [Candidatus Acidoferrales bacterium]